MKFYVVAIDGNVQYRAFITMEELCEIYQLPADKAMHVKNNRIYIIFEVEIKPKKKGEKIKIEDLFGDGKV